MTAVTRALDAGLPAVQLREKDLPGRPLLELADALRRATARTGALFFVNDRVDVALAVGADGVHLGEGSMPAEAVRGLVPPGTAIGVSTHAAGAVPAEADFAFFGPVWETPAKTGAQGVDRLRAAIAASPVPVLAIGGVDWKRAGEARAAGAAGVAVIRAILSANDPALATRELLAAVPD